MVLLSLNEVLQFSFSVAFKDCISIIPLLLLIFYIIEIIEFFYSDKILSFAKFSKKAGPFVGALLAVIPQCGLSIIASSMYCRRFITKGTLIAVYLATSDEAIPVLLASPGRLNIIFLLMGIKLAVALFAGYLIDFIFKSKVDFSEVQNEKIQIEKGCHSHDIIKDEDGKCNGKVGFREVFLHPLVHTLSVTFFIFAVTFLINILVYGFSSGNFSSLQNVVLLKNNFVQPVIAAIFGIIPNCAVSVGVTVLYLKGVITFASCVSGLCAGAGLGLLVLVKNNKDKKDTALILALLLITSILAGYITLFLPHIK